MPIVVLVEFEKLSIDGFNQNIGLVPIPRFTAQSIKNAEESRTNIPLRLAFSYTTHRV